MTTKHYKSLVYAFPGTIAAQELGFGEAGGWYIQRDTLHPNGRYTSAVYPDTEWASSSVPNATLLKLFNECPVDIFHAASVHEYYKTLIV